MEKVTCFHLLQFNRILLKVSYPRNESHILQLLAKVLVQIPESEKTIIQDQLGLIKFLDYSALSLNLLKNFHFKPTEGGATYLYRIKTKCEMRVDISRSTEIIIKSIAHELAHVFYNHPFIAEGLYEAEKEAQDKSREWGFE
jgi:hypothetical protein